MRRVKSFDENLPSLYIVATPIGNLKEMTPRAVEVLQQVDYIAAEDTRVTSKLLSYFDIHTKIIAHHKFNELNSSDGILKLLNEGSSIAIVSDAGYPLISDPGFLLSKKVIEAGYRVIPISGSNACLNALVASGIATQPFLFYGFLDAHTNQREKQLEELKQQPYTLLFYEAPHRIHKTLQSMSTILGNRNLTIAKELTKKHEEFFYGTIQELLEVEHFQGELVMVVEGKKEEEIEVSMPQLLQEIEVLVRRGTKKGDAIKRVAQDYHVKKNDLYRAYHEGEK